MKKRIHKISDNAIRRFPRYLRCLDEFEANGYNHVSSAQIGEHLHVTPSQVRQDFSQFGSYGQQGYGYDISFLRRSIKEIIGINMQHSIIIIVVGSLGHALIEHLPLTANSYHMLAGFDIDVTRIGTYVAGVPIYDENTLEAYITEHRPDICILTVPASAAMDYAKRLTDSGVKAIWNFTGLDINTTWANATIENVNLMDGLFALTYYGFPNEST